MFTYNRMQRHWEETKVFIRENWPQFTDVEFRQINGDFDKFLFYLKEFYGGFPKTDADARVKLQKFLNKMDDQHPERIQLNT